MATFKKFLARYGVFFFPAYLVAFAFLVAVAPKDRVNPLLLDVVIRRESFILYFPFGSAFAIALAALIIFEIAKAILSNK